MKVTNHRHQMILLIMRLKRITWAMMRRLILSPQIQALLVRIPIPDRETPILYHNLVPHYPAQRQYVARSDPPREKQRHATRMKLPIEINNGEFERPTSDHLEKHMELRLSFTKPTTYNKTRFPDTIYKHFLCLQRISTQTQYRDIITKQPSPSNHNNGESQWRKKSTLTSLSQHGN